jgi:hypothetical protein
VIDHSYDNELDQKKRFSLFVKELKRLNDNKENLIEFYKNNQHRFEENKNKVIKIKMLVRNKNIMNTRYIYVPYPIYIFYPNQDLLTPINL